MRFADRNRPARRGLRVVGSWLVVPVVLIALLVACGSESAAPTVQSDPAGQASTDEESAGQGTDASDVVTAVTGPVFETVDGGTFDLGSIEGTDTVLWFWAPW